MDIHAQTETFDKLIEMAEYSAISLSMALTKRMRENPYLADAIYMATQRLAIGPVTIIINEETEST